MDKYNCIIKELSVDGKGQPKILGRIFLQDLSQIPDWWQVKLRGSFISDIDTDLEKLMCTSTNPLVIYKKPAANISPDEQDVTIRNNPVKLPDDIIEGFECQEDFDDAEIIEFQAAFSTGLNIGAGSIHGIGVKTSDLWKSYRHGMNLAGECPNTECDSRKEAETEIQVFYNNGYGEIYLPDDMYKFNCPACGDSSFHISNFVLSCGRALFRYKESGIDSDVKEVILESSGPLEEYKTFETQADQPISDYDFVLIITVASNQSFYYCMACDETIDEVEDEVMLSCGHSFHKSTCLTSSNIGCIVCESEPLESFAFLLTVGNS